MDQLSPKQPAEKDWYRFGLSNYFSDENAIESVVVLVEIDGTTTDVTATLCDTTKTNIDGTNVYVWLRAGTNGVKYKITIKATGENGNLVEKEATISVIEK